MIVLKISIIYNHQSFSLFKKKNKHCISCSGVNEILHNLMHIKPLKITEEHLAVLTVEWENLALCMDESHGNMSRLHFTPKCVEKKI